MKKLLISLFLFFSLMSIESYCTCPTNWIEEDITFYYGTNCAVNVHHKYRLNAQCEVELQVMYWSFSAGSPDCEHLTKYPTLHFIDSLYNNSFNRAISMLGIPLCDFPNGQEMYSYTSEKYSCTYLSSNGWVMFFPKNCDPSQICIRKYKICLGYDFSCGLFKVISTLVESRLEGSSYYCNTVPEFNLIVWYDSNGNEILGDPWNTTLHPLGPGGTPSPTIAWPIRTDCYSFFGCD